MSKVDTKLKKRKKRKLRIRKKIIGTLERPRVSIFRSNKNIYVQAIDDSKSHTIASLSTVGSKNKFTKITVSSASALGEEFGKILLSLNINELVFDRNGMLYHGVIKAFAEGSRKSGIKF